MKEGFVLSPHLPTGPATLCAVGERAAFLAGALASFGVQPLWVGRSGRLPPPVADHPDLRLLHLGGEEVLVEQGESRLSAALQAQGFRTASIDRPSAAVYPQDALLDIALIGKHMFYGKEPPDRRVLHYCDKFNIQRISTAQGYAKCSVAIVREDALITADPSIAQAARAHGLDVLQITPGHIQLSGYSYGLIGGCCGLLDQNLLAFSGAIQQHPDYLAIRSFCKNRQVEVVALSQNPLVDIGGILPLQQKMAARPRRRGAIHSPKPIEGYIGKAYNVISLNKNLAKLREEENHCHSRLPPMRIAQSSCGIFCST